MKYCGSIYLLKKKGVTLTVLFVMILMAMPGALYAQTVAAWFSKSANAAVYSSIENETKAMAQQFQSLGLSDSILTARLEEAYRKHVNTATLLASLKIDTQRAVQLSSILHESGLFLSDKKIATATVEQMLIFMRAGLTEAEMRGALQAGVAKSGKSANAVRRALAALATIATANAQSEMTEQERLSLASELISSSLSENQFEPMVAARNASKLSEGQVSEVSSKSSDNVQGSKAQDGKAQDVKQELGKPEVDQSSSGNGSASGDTQGIQGLRYESNGQAGQSAGPHGKK